MDTDWLMIATRFGLYFCLILLPGLSAFPLYALQESERSDDAVLSLRRVLSIGAVTGLVLSGFGFLVLMESMTGNPLAEPDWETGRAILSESAIGTAWLVRMVALSAALLALLFCRSNLQRLMMTTLAAAAALSTLVWTGHAGAGEGRLGLLHIASDVLHMFAAAVWLGGIAAFLMLLRPARDEASGNRIVIAHRALEQFSFVGAICVSIIAITGLINGQILVGYANLFDLPGSPYGQLLIAKIMLVGAMILLAAQNRWRLTPSLHEAIAQGETASATAAMRKSLLLEAGAAMAILFLVAWLGTLEPIASVAIA